MRFERGWGDDGRRGGGGGVREGGDEGGDEGRNVVRGEKGFIEGL